MGNDRVKYRSIKRIIALAMILIMTAGSSVRSHAAVGHDYYKGIPAQGAAMADGIARAIAYNVMSNPAYVTDLQKIQAAASIVASYASRDVYGSDVNRYYRSPYGVFVSGNYTCAGTTRALGRVLDFMGYSWIHANENQYCHQWCIVLADGQWAYADGMAGIAGYGQYQSGTVLPDGSVIIFY